MSRLIRSFAPILIAATITRKRPGVAPLRTDELADIAGSYRVAENHLTRHRDNLYRHVIWFVHHELDDVGDCFDDRPCRFHWQSLASPNLYDNRPS
jgi:hypothetical protein